MAVIKINGRILYPYESETVLETLERYGYNPDYQCRLGYCGHCHIRLIQGKVLYRESVLAYIRPDYFLACSCMAKTDIEIEGVMESIPILALKDSK